MRHHCQQVSMAALQICCGSCKNMINGELLQHTLCAPESCLACVLEQSMTRGACLGLMRLFVCAVPPQLLPRLLQAQQFKCPHCRTTQGLPEGLGMQQDAQLMSAAPERVISQSLFPLMRLLRPWSTKWNVTDLPSSDGQIAETSVTVDRLITSQRSGLQS